MKRAKGPRTWAVDRVTLPLSTPALDVGLRPGETTAGQPSAASDNLADATAFPSSVPAPPSLPAEDLAPARPLPLRPALPSQRCAVSTPGEPPWRRGRIDCDPLLLPALLPHPPVRLSVCRGHCSRSVSPEPPLQRLRKTRERTTLPVTPGALPEPCRAKCSVTDRGEGGAVCLFPSSRTWVGALGGPLGWE